MRTDFSERELFNQDNWRYLMIFRHTKWRRFHTRSSIQGA